MPTKRTRRPRQRIEFDEVVLLHLQTGDCLLAGPGEGCGCGLIGPDGVLRRDLERAAREHFGLRKGASDDGDEAQT
jgi:hypothetical protein